MKKVNKQGGSIPPYTSNGKWEVVEDLAGLPSHAEGGVDLSIKDGKVTFTRDGNGIYAEKGVVINKRQARPVVDTTGYSQRSIDVMNSNRNLNSIQRALDPSKYPTYKFDNKGNHGTHKMGYAEFDDGNYAFPQIVQKDGDSNLTYFKTPKEAIEYAKQTKTLIPLGNDKDFAEYFTSVGYKHSFPKDVYDAAMHDYVKRTNIKPPVAATSTVNHKNFKNHNHDKSNSRGFGADPS